MIQIATVAGAMLHLLSAGALATTQADPPVVTATPAVTKADKKVCRSIVPTGSVMAKRFCLTKVEWRTFNALNQADADGALRHRGTGMCGSPTDPCG